jgi:hypothetical protein
VLLPGSSEEHPYFEIIALNVADYVGNQRYALAV